MLDIALSYVQRGWWVLPLTPGQKTPLGRLVPRGHLDATRDENQVREWWGTYPAANIGIALAPSRLSTLDVDVANGKHGFKSLAQIDEHLPATLLARTGRGGLHGIFERPDGTPPRRIIGFLPGLDLLSDGYIVAAGSMLADVADGGEYRWENATPIAMLPPFLQQVSSKPREHATVTAVGTPIVEGNRNQALFRLGCALRDTGIGAESLARALDAENQERIKPPLDDSELRTIVNSVMTRVQPSFDVAANAAVGSEVQQMFGGVTPAAPGIERAGYGVAASEYFGEDDPGNSPDDWFVEGLIAEAVPQMIAGHPKSKKTFLLEYLMLCAALGLPAFGKFKTKQVPSLLLPLEDAVKETQRRLWRLARGIAHQHGFAFDKRALEGWLKVDSLKPFYWSDRANLDEMLRTIERDRLGLIGVDCLSRSHDGDENAVKEMAPVLNRWADVCMQTRVAIPIIHHFTKSGQGTLLQQLRGSGSIGATLRHVVGVEKPKERDDPFELSFDGNLHPLPDTFTIQMRDAKNDAGQDIILFECAESKRGAVSEGDIAAKFLALVHEYAAKGDFKTLRRWREDGGLGAHPTRRAYEMLGPAGSRQLETREHHPILHTPPRGGGVFVVPTGAGY